MKKLIVAGLALPLLLAGCTQGQASQSAERERATSGSGGNETLTAPPTRRVWTEPDDFGQVSPRDPIISFVDWNTGGDVAVHDFTTGEDRLVTDHGDWLDGRGWAERPVFSQDGSEIAYAFGNTQLAQVEGGEEPFLYQLRIVGLDGSADRSIWQAETFQDFTRPMDWSRDRGIVVASWTQEVPQGGLALVSPEDGTFQFLKYFEEGTPCPCVEEAVFSPDGSFLAYREGAEIRLWNMDTGSDSDLEVEARTIVEWTPDGSGFLVHTSIDGRTGFWLIPISNGQAGPPQLVRGGIPFALTAGRTGDSFYYYIPVEGPQLFQASVDLETGQMLSTPAALTPTTNAAVNGPAWSPDGRQLAYSTMDADRNWSLFLRSADGDEITALADLGKIRQVEYLTWSADGSALHFMAYIQDQRHLMRTDTRTGATEELLVSPPDEGPRPALLTHDGTRAIVSRSFSAEEGEISRGLLVKELASGRETLLSSDVPEAMGLSPDGSTIATLVLDPETEQTRRLILQPLDGSPPTILAEQVREIGSIQRASALGWSPDGRFILATYWTAPSGDTPERYDMMAYPVDGGDPVPLGQVENVRAAPNLHPDGRRLLYVDGNLSGEIWVMEGWR